MNCSEKCSNGFHRFIVNINGRREWNTVRCICHNSTSKGAKGYGREVIKIFPNFVEFEGTGIVDYMGQH